MWASGLVTGLVPARSWDRSPSWAVSPQEDGRIGKDKEIGSSPAEMIAIRRGSQDTKGIREEVMRGAREFAREGIRRRKILLKFVESGL